MTFSKIFGLDLSEFEHIHARAYIHNHLYDFDKISQESLLASVVIHVPVIDVFRMADF